MLPQKHNVARALKQLLGHGVVAIVLGGCLVLADFVWANLLAQPCTSPRPTAPVLLWALS